MKLQNIKKLELIEETRKLNELKSVANTIQSMIEKYNGKSWREPFKTKFLEEIKNISNNINAYICSDNSVAIYHKEEFFNYYDLSKLANDNELRRFKYDNEYSIYGVRQYVRQNISFNFKLNDTKVNNDNNLTEIIENLGRKINENERVLLTFDNDIEMLSKLTSEINSLFEQYNTINYKTRTMYNNDDYHLWKLKSYNGIVSNPNNSNYTTLELDYNIILTNIINNSNYANNNLTDLIDVKIDEENQYLKFYFYKKDEEQVLIYNYFTNEIVKNIYNDLSYNDFAKLENLNDNDFNVLKRTMLIKLRNLKNKDIINENITYNDFAFITSSSLSGFYLPNENITYNDYKFTCFAFIKNCCYAVFEKDNEIIVL